MRSDNMAVISAINSGKVKDDFLGHGMRYVHCEMAVRDAKLSLIYVYTKENVIADGLSRGDEGTVKDWKGKGFKQVFVPQSRLSQLISLDL